MPFHEIVAIESINQVFASEGVDLTAMLKIKLGRFIENTWKLEWDKIPV